MPVRRFDHPDIPEDVWVTLQNNTARANIILPHAEKQIWLVYSELTASNIRFILVSTEGPLGKYPLFIVPIAPIKLTPELLQGPMEAFCEVLLNEVDVRRQRVFSVFSVEPVTKAFASAWEKIADIKCMNEPYYDAIFSMCTSETLVRNGPQSEDVILEPHPAVPQDLNEIAKLCREFASTSHPFILSSKQASEEARRNGQVWVREIKKAGGETDIVAALTEISMLEKWQCKGRAERLICQCPW
ncbi:hypothetical protein BDR05DRAFT_964993 [Suillus weaverae]|nr:hypothetical protein BDR05DRAFT_964993 [Suillus weaverae]